MCGVYCIIYTVVSALIKCFKVDSQGNINLLSIHPYLSSLYKAVIRCGVF